MEDYYEQKCEFCGSFNIRVPHIGISFGMYGFSYDFCGKCLDGMTANEFWSEIFKNQELAYPPKLTPQLQEAVDNNIDPDNIIYPEGENSMRGCSTTVKKKTKKEKERNKMSNSLRYDFLKRDNFFCQICGATGKDAILVIDHIIPIAKNGKTVKDNLRTLCQACNSGKAAK